MRNGNKLIAVVMGSSSSAVRNANVEGLLLTGFDIMDRRARGERIELTQNLFENPGPSSYASNGRISLSQGEGDADRNSVLVLAKTAPHPLTVVALISSTARNWWVQVGAFRSHNDAKAQIEKLSRQFAKIFDDAEGSVLRGGHEYRARFSGFTQFAAQEACSTVRTHGVSCAVGGPA